MDDKFNEIELPRAKATNLFSDGGLGKVDPISPSGRTVMTGVLGAFILIQGHAYVITGRTFLHKPQKQ